MTLNSKFHADLKKFSKKVEVKTENLVKSTARATYKVITHMAPVKTGSYVKSNRIGIGSIDPQVITIPEELALGENEAKSQAYIEQLPKIELFRLENKFISISNNIHYALKVEYGWPKHGKRGYAPYRMAYEVVKAGII